MVHVEAAPWFHLLKQSEQPLDRSACCCPLGGGGGAQVNREFNTMCKQVTCQISQSVGIEVWPSAVAQETLEAKSAQPRSLTFCTATATPALFILGLHHKRSSQPAEPF